MRKLSVSLAIAASLLVAACGGGGSGGGSSAPVTPSSVTVPVTCTSPQVLQGNVCVTPVVQVTCTSPQVLQGNVCVTPAPAPVPVTYKSTDWNAAIAWWSDSTSASYSDAQVKAMIDHLKAVGYSGITFTYQLQLNLVDGTMQSNSVIDGANTRMYQMLDYAYSQGMNVNTKVYWSTSASSNGLNQWNANPSLATGTPTANCWVDPAHITDVQQSCATKLLQGLDNYFTAYTAVNGPAAAHHISTIIVGTESDFMAFNQYHPQWAAIVSHMRANYAGKITYDAIYAARQGENFPKVTVWDVMDEIGLSFYPTFSGAPVTTLSAAIATWTYRDATSIRNTVHTDLNDPCNCTPYTSIVADLTQVKATWNKNIVFTENTLQNSQYAMMNWVPASTLITDGIAVDSAQHVFVQQAELEVIKTSLHGVVTGFHMMGYDPWEYAALAGNNGTYALWAQYDQLMNTPAETVMQTYLQAGL